MKIKIFTFLLFFIFYKSFAYSDILQDSKFWKFFAKITNDAVTNFPDIPMFKSELQQGILKFGSATYIGTIKSGKAHGEGVFMFPDGTKYEGKFKRNMFHGEGTFIDPNGNSHEGNWKYNKLRSQIDDNTREVVQLSKALGKSEFFEIRGSGQLTHKWFEAEMTQVNVKKAEMSKELDIFDLPSVFSEDYGDESKIQEILDKKNAQITSQNEKTSKDISNMQTVFVLTAKGEQDMQSEKKAVAINNDVYQNPHSGTSKGGMSGGGGGC